MPKRSLVIEVLEIEEAVLKDSWNPVYVFVHSNIPMLGGGFVEKEFLEVVPPQVGAYFTLKWGIHGTVMLTPSAYQPHELGQEQLKEVKNLERHHHLYTAFVENRPMMPEILLIIRVHIR
jgi:hypothetical protein